MQATLPPEALHAPVRRLTGEEMVQSIADLTHVDPSKFDDIQLPVEPLTTPFHNAADLQTVTSDHVELYTQIAERAAREALANNPATLVGCDMKTAEASSCMRSFSDRFGRLVYRRKLESVEVDDLVALGVSQSDPKDVWAGPRSILEALFQCSDFLFRPELGTSSAESAFPKLTGPELATRMSYLLWGSAPDAALLDDAEQGRLETADNVEAAARRMMKADAAKRTLDGFIAQWFGIEEIYARKYELEGWDIQVRSPMFRGTVRTAEDYIWPAGVNFLDLFTSPFTYVDSALAGFYGLSGVNGAELQKVTLPTSSQRRGALTDGSILMTHRSITQRGKFVRSTLLCDPPPPPPPNIPPLPPTKDGQSERDRLAEHTKNPACSGCHNRLDPIGVGLLSFNNGGALRDKDEAGKPLDLHGTIEGETQPTFNGGIELGQRIHDSPLASSCVVTQVFRFAFGRSEAALGRTDADRAQDKAVIDDLNGAFVDKAHSFSELLVAFARSDEFRFKRTALQATGNGP